MNIIDAADATAHDYPGGCEALGPRIGISAGVLRNKVNPNNTTHHLSLAEADRMMRLTSDHRILQALAHTHGFLLVKAPDPNASESDMSVLEQMTALLVANGAFGQEVFNALADGKVDEGDMQKVRRAKRTLQTSAAEVVQRLDGMVG